MGVRLKIVADTSVLISVLTNEVHKAQIVTLTQNSDLIAPASLHWEIGNAFSAMFKRRRIDIDQALEAMVNYKQIPIRFVDVDLESAISLSHKLNIYAYDAYFIVCAQQQKASLLTLDNKLSQVSKEIGIKVIEV